MEQKETKISIYIKETEQKGESGEPICTVSFTVDGAEGRTFTDVIQGITIVIDHLINEQKRIYGTENRIQLVESKASEESA